MNDAKSSRLRRALQALTAAVRWYMVELADGSLVEVEAISAVAAGDTVTARRDLPDSSVAGVWAMPASMAGERRVA